MAHSTLFLVLAAAFLSLLLGLIFFISRHQRLSRHKIDQLEGMLTNQGQEWRNHLAKLEERGANHHHLMESVFRLIHNQERIHQEDRRHQNEHHVHLLSTLQQGLHTGMLEVREQVGASLTQHAQSINQRISDLTHVTEQRLRDISMEVEKRLSDGFDKTTHIFTDVIKRLTLIDEAQNKMAELSGQVMNLRDILADKRSRGAFGEVQLTALIRNVLPESAFVLQHTLSNGKRVDCMLLLPEPTGKLAIDAKFPLETFRAIMEQTSPVDGTTKSTLEQTFRKDIRKHIQDIAQKYILPNETADGAMMFIPAESIFAEIHSHYPDLVEFAHQQRVWMVSPTTMMAVLTTARAVLKDAATRQQLHIIQEHLFRLRQDFERFELRMHKLARDIKKAHEDAQEVHISSKKITSRFHKIEQVEPLSGQEFPIPTNANLNT